MADMEMVDHARGHPVYTEDYFATAVTSEYLESLREEIQIPENVELVVPDPDDLPSRPPPNNVTLSMEFFRASLCLSFHPFLRWTLRRLNVATMQLNANAYRILINYFILWVKYFCMELPFNAF